MKLAMRLADDGATVYASYFAGSQPGQRGPWMPWLERAFGVRHHLRYGLGDPIEDVEVTFEMIADLGELVAGTTLNFPVGGNADARAYLPVEPDGPRYWRSTATAARPCCATRQAKGPWCCAPTP